MRLAAVSPTCLSAAHTFACVVSFWSFVEAEHLLLSSAAYRFTSHVPMLSHQNLLRSPQKQALRVHSSKSILAGSSAETARALVSQPFGRSACQQCGGVMICSSVLPCWLNFRQMIPLRKSAASAGLMMGCRDEDSSGRTARRKEVTV